MTVTTNAAPQGATPGASTLEALGEREVLRRILPLLPQGTATILGPGDDAAVVAAPDGRFVVTTDTMLEGADFRMAWSTWSDLGRKAAATNLADVAAMGATPTALVVAIAAPGSTPVGDLEAFASGLAAAASDLAPGCGVVGGDLSTAEHVVIAVTAFGDLEGRTPVTRSGARPGDVVVVAGELGLAAAGIRLLFHDASNAGVADRARGLAVKAAHPAVVTAQLAPTPPIQAGVALARAGATAMLDVSDSVALDASRIAEASGVRIALDTAALAPLHDDVTLDDVLFGGEDHAMLATLPATAALPPGVRVIGRVEAGTGVSVDGSAIGARGWDPFRT